jgi:hypothetical protein
MRAGQVEDKTGADRSQIVTSKGRGRFQFIAPAPDLALGRGQGMPEHGHCRVPNLTTKPDLLLGAGLTTPPKPTTGGLRISREQTQFRQKAIGF